MAGNIELERMLSVGDLIEHLKEENIKFEIASELSSKGYLRYNNNYYSVTSFKNLFPIYQYGNLKGKYLDLDFAYLKDLSIIDFKLRLILFDMLSDIEKYLKLRILNYAEVLKREDGYTTVNKFLYEDYSNKERTKRIHKSILDKKDNLSLKRIFSKYEIKESKLINNIPIWEFLEILTLGELISFYIYFAKEYNLKDDIENGYILRVVNKLRNSVYHGTNILNTIGDKDNYKHVNYNIRKYLEDCGVGKQAQFVKLKNSTIEQLTCTLYMFNEIVTSEEVKSKVYGKLNDFFYDRIPRNKKYYKNNGLLISTYSYFDKIIKKYYTLEEKLEKQLD